MVLLQHQRRNADRLAEAGRQVVLLQQQRSHGHRYPDHQRQDLSVRRERCMVKLNELKIRILMEFWNSGGDKKKVGIVHLSRIFDVDKRMVSREMTALEEMGFLERKEPRHPVLTDIGWQETRLYADRIRDITEYLMGCGVDEEHASRDAFYLAIYSSHETLDQIGRAHV